MKKIFKNKLFIISLILVVLGGVAGTYLFVLKPKDSTNTSIEQKEIKVDNLLGYIGSESSYSKFNALIGMFDSSKYLTKNEEGLEPSLLVFAPSNDAFSDEDMKPFESINAAAREQVKLYHMAKIYPSAVGAQANLELSDGMKIVTLSGRDLTIKKSDSNFIVTDGKGRDALVSSKYAISNKGDRIYFIDNVLLFQ